MMQTKNHRFTSSQQLFLGLFAGILLGLFLGDLAGFINIFAEGYIQLLQMTVLPYVTVSLISGLGSLTYQQAKLLFTKVGALILVLWAMAFVVLFFMPYAFPAWESASFFSTSLLRVKEDFDFLGLYIPSNPFYSLANNMVPAVVLFSVATGIALIGVEKKNRLIENLAVLNGALTTVNRFVVRLAPFGIFAIAANMAGTMSIEELGRLQVFFITFVLIALLFTFWLLPGLVSALTPIGYREILGLTKDALLTAFMTGNLFIVLPMLIDASKELLRRHKLADEESESLPEVIVPTTFNFPHTGKVLTLSFLLFAAWFSEVAISWTEYPRFALTGLASFFGSVNVAVPFLLDTLEIPADMFELFLATSVVNSRFGTLVAAMHTMTIALLGTAAALGTLRIQSNKLLRYGILSAALVALTIGGSRFAFEQILEDEYHKDKVLESMHLIRSPGPATVFREPPAEPLSTPGPGETHLDRIKQRDAIRVGYLTDGLPYSYFNISGDLVGFDIEMAHELAKELDVDLELVPVDRLRLAQQLDGCYCDIVMAGIAVTTMRARDMLFSDSYMDETAAFVVKDHDRARFASMEDIQNIASLKLRVPNLPNIISFVHQRLPHAEIVPISSTQECFEGVADEFDACFMTAERGSALCLLHPQFTVVVPMPNPSRIPLAYPVAGRDEVMADFMNTWIQLKKKEGFVQSLYDYWILGKDAEPKQPRWSILRNVLHWVE